MWVSLVLYSAMQLLAAYGLEVNNNRPALDVYKRQEETDWSIYKTGARW